MYDIWEIWLPILQIQILQFKWLNNWKTVCFIVSFAFIDFLNFERIREISQ